MTLTLIVAVILLSTLAVLAGISAWTRHFSRSATRPIIGRLACFVLYSPVSLVISLMLLVIGPTLMLLDVIDQFVLNKVIAPLAGVKR